MKWLIALCVVLIGGLAGVIALHESGRGLAGGASTGGASAAVVATISSGETVTIEDHLADGVFTVVEFTADW